MAVLDRWLLYIVGLSAHNFYTIITNIPGLPHWTSTIDSDGHPSPEMVQLQREASVPTQDFLTGKIFVLGGSSSSLTFLKSIAEVCTVSLHTTSALSYVKPSAQM